MKEKILIVEDDLALSAGLCFELQADGYIAMAAYNSAGSGSQLHRPEDGR
ncbi:hypothetical protein [Diplocloster modestus]|uniref:Uncharacterized protein n=1 Tax=Diplocloster modestus TaxID=2850322 RepID=A0ABS6K9Q1_9FIRM|nr:hypothetical protein [Diplocloster modestus]MBU9727240.1 hypothetical protein [Diplocloster modestus]